MIKLAFVVVLLAAATAAGQEPTVVIMGRVVDQQGEVLSNAIVGIRRLGAQAMTGDDGRFALHVPRRPLAARETLLVRRIGYDPTRVVVEIAAADSIDVEAVITLRTVVIGIDAVVVYETEDHRARPPRFAELLRAVSVPEVTLEPPFERGSYEDVRRFLVDGESPPPDIVRPEGFINYAPQPWPARAGKAPIALAADVVDAPWSPRLKLVRATLQARPRTLEGAPRNLVVVLDVSSTTWQADRLPRARRALERLAAALRPEDRLSLIVFGGPRGVLLDGVAGRNQARIRAALDSATQGPTATEEGDILARALHSARSGPPASESHILVFANSDDAVPMLGNESLELARRARVSGVRVDVVRLATTEAGARLDAIARAGGGRSWAASDEPAMQHIIGRVVGVSLATAAIDPRFVLRADPSTVRAWRCLNDVGANDSAPKRREPELLYSGESLTVLCEIEPARDDGVVPAGSITVRATYRQTSGARRELAAVAAPDSLLEPQSRFLGAVAGTSLVLRRSPALASWSLDDVAAYIRALSLPDEGGYVEEFVDLVERAARLRHAKP